MERVKAPSSSGGPIPPSEVTAMRIDRRVLNPFAPVLETGVYRTRPGDTLRRIAERLGLRLSDLLAANSHIESADALLPPGQTIRLPTEQGPTVASRSSALMSFRVDYEKSRPNVFQRFAGRPSHPEMSGPGGGPQGPSDAEIIFKAIGEVLNKESATLGLIQAINEFCQALADASPDQKFPEVKVRVGRLIAEMVKQAQARHPQNLSDAIKAVTEWVQAINDNYRRLKNYGFPPSMALTFALPGAFFQVKAKQLLIECLKDASLKYSKYFSEIDPRNPNPLKWISAVLTFTEVVCGVTLPQTLKDLFKVLKYLPSTAVASLMGDTAKVVTDLTWALLLSGLGDTSEWNKIILRMLNQEYGPVYQGWAFLADLVITGGRNIEKVPVDKILFSDLFDTGPVFRATPQLDRFLRTLREPVFLSGLYRTGQLDPVAVASQLFIDVEQNGTRLNFVGRLTSALEAIASDVRMGRRTYDEWVMFREVVGAVVAEVLWRADLPSSDRFRREVDRDALRRFYQKLISPLTDQELREWAERHEAAWSVFWSNEVTE
jgi:hypothetical protein